MTSWLFGLALLPAIVTAQTNFGPVGLGSSADATVTLTIASGGTLSSISVVTQGAPNLDFTNAGGGTCSTGTAYSATATCTVTVTFAPKYAGARYGAVVLQSTSGVLAIAYLQGTGEASPAPQAVFLPGAQTAIVSPVLNSGGAAVDGSGNVYLAQESYRTGAPVPPAVPGAVTKYILSNGQYTGISIGSGFGSPSGIAVDGSGNVYIADSGFSLVYYWDGHKISTSIPSNVYKETLEPDGSYTESAFGSGWSSPSAVAVDGSGNVYVADAGASEVYRETPMPNGSYTQTAVGSGWSSPIAIAVDGSGNVYVADSSKVYKETPLSNGSYTKTAIIQGLSGGLAVDGSGSLFIADGTVYRETLLSNGTYAQGVAATTQSGSPSAVAVDASGNLYICYDDSTLQGIHLAGTLDKVVPQDPPALSFAATVVGSTSNDSPQAVTISNVGDAALKFSEVNFPPDFPEAGGVTNECTPGASLDPEGSCELTIDFKPVADTSVVLTESVTLTTNGNNGNPEQEAIPVSGTELNSNKFTPGVQLTSNVNPSVLGKPITFEAAVTGTSGVAAPSGNVTFYSGAAVLYSATLESGLAAYTTSSLAAGTHTITATYSGDSNYWEEASNPIDETILIPPPTYVIGDVNIGTVPIGEAVSAIPVKVTFNDPEILGSIAVLTQGVAGQDFTDAGGGTCEPGSTYAANATCTVTITFSPKHAGTRYGAVVLRDANQDLLGTGFLQGVGAGPQTTFPPGTQATILSGLDSNNSVAVDGSGNLFVTDFARGGTAPPSVYKETLQPNGEYVRTEIGSGWTSPTTVAVDGAGNVYVSDYVNGFGTQERFVEESPQPNGGYTQAVLSFGFAATGGRQAGLAVDGSGNIYAVDGQNVYRETLQPNGNYIQTMIASGFISIVGVAVDGNGSVYVNDAPGGDSGSVYKETLQQNGNYIQTTIGKGWIDPFGLAVDGDGNVYVADLAGWVDKETLQPDGSYMQSAIGSQWLSPSAVAVDGSGNVYVVQDGEGLSDIVDKVNLADPPALSFASAAYGATSLDSPKTITVSNLGNEPLAFSAVSYPANFPEASGFASDCMSNTSLAAGANCTLSINFTPVAALSSGSSAALSGSVSITTNALNATATEQNVPVSGTETKASSVRLSALPNPAKAGATVTFKATVAGAGEGAPVPTGKVTFYSGSSSLGSAALSSGVATLATNKLASGKRSITAEYPGDANYTASTSSALIEVIDKLTPTVKLVSSANPGKVERSIKFTAEVTGTNGILPAGTVEFYSGTKLLGTATLSKGAAEFSAKLAAGKYAITAKYEGDTDYNAVTSAVLAEVIDKLVPAVKLASSANPAKAGSTVTFKATVTGSGTGPAGTVIFKSGTRTLATVTLSDGKAAYSTSKLAAGTYSITASYSGSAVYAAEKSAPLKETIDK